jgi:hypothetical protein
LPFNTFESGAWVSFDSRIKRLRPIWLSSLEAQRHTLPQIAQNTIPNAQKANENRAEIFAVRKELLEVLVAK